MPGSEGSTPDDRLSLDHDGHHLGGDRLRHHLLLLQGPQEEGGLVRAKMGTMRKHYDFSKAPEGENEDHFHAGSASRGLCSATYAQSVSTQVVRDGNDFLRRCPTDLPSLDSVGRIEAAWCIGLLEGFQAGVTVFQGLTEIGGLPKFICLPADGIPPGQMQRITVKWLEDNPNRLHEDMRILIMSSLMDAFPCARN